VFRRIGIGKALLIYVCITAAIVLGMSTAFFYTSQEAISSIENVSQSATGKLTMQNSLIKSMALVQSNILPLAAETDPDSREIRLELVKGFLSEFKTLVAKCGADCDGLKENILKYENTWDAITKKIAANNLAGASSDIINSLNPLAESLFDKLDKAATEVSKATQTEFEASRLAAEKTKKILLALIGILAFGILAAGYIFQRKLVSTISTVVDKVHSSAQTTSTKTSEVSESTETLSGASTRQAASIEETVASLEEMSSMVKRNAEHAKLAAELSHQSTSAATDGGRQINDLIASMKEINKSSKKIEEIIAVIDDIAFQTNLLALNAAVEAARAGEQGKGFAVVAEAVRSLAQRSAEAAKEIGSIIDESVTQTEHGTKIADNSGEALGKIIQSIQKVSELNNEISVASQEQAQGITQLSKAMSEIDQTTQTNASVAENLSQSSQTLVSESESLAEYTTELETLLKGSKPTA